MKKAGRLNYLVFVLAMGVIVAIGGCKNTQQTASVSKTGSSKQVYSDTHNSRNSLDWAGLYTGSGLRADTATVQAILQLKADGTFHLRYSYAGNRDSAFEKRGTFKWDKTGSQVTLNPQDKTPVTYRVLENRLEQIDNQRRITDREFNYLTRFEKLDPHMIQEKYWKLTRINGQPIEFTGSKEPHMILKSADSTVQGFAGCNGFGGHFELLTGNRIRFSKMMSTMMACPDLPLEKAFLNILEKADNYTQHGDTLYLNKARMAPLAQFVAVYF